MFMFIRYRMPTPLNRLTPASHAHSSPELLGERPRLSPHSPSVGSKRKAASAELDALSPRKAADSSDAHAAAPAPGPANKRPRVAMQALSSLSARPPVDAGPAASQAASSAQHHDVDSHDVEPHEIEHPVLGRHFDAHASHRLEDIIHRLNTLHHDYGKELTPKMVEQIRREISELHQIAKMILDIKKRLMRKKK
ncbi:hypothetical protein [Trinickia sp.]|uniref:hypothetical protein n=1 Tax=Trinickia sp. TaxID=2571163 RepID=UPI003F7E6FFF